MSARQYFKIIILGDSGVGKSSLLVQYVNREFSGEYKATIGADFLSKDIIVDDKETSLQIWDTAGQERFVSLCFAFFRGSDACVLVYDINDTSSVTALERWRDEFLKYIDKPPQNFPFFVFGNKFDARTKFSDENIDKAKAWALQYNIPHFLTSAKDGLGLDSAFIDIAKAIVSYERNNPVSLDKDSIIVKEKLHEDDCVC